MTPQQYDSNIVNLAFALGMVTATGLMVALFLALGEILL